MNQSDDGESKLRGLAEYLGELQQKDDANDRYIAALRRETLGRNPYVRRSTKKKSRESYCLLKSNGKFYIFWILMMYNDQSFRFVQIKPNSRHYSCKRRTKALLRWSPV